MEIREGKEKSSSIVLHNETIVIDKNKSYCEGFLFEGLFSSPVKVKPGVIYSLLQRIKTGKSFYGEGGSLECTGTSGANFVFSACPMSKNGSSNVRG
jgi:hypothetical protein